MSASQDLSLAQKLISRVAILQSFKTTAQTSGPVVDDAQDTVLTDEVKLDLFESALDSATALTSVSPPPPQMGSFTKGVEKAEAKQVPSVEVPGITYVEKEPQPEIPVEVEGFLQRVEDSADKLKQEIVLADKNLVTQNQSHPTQPVVVLPISEKMEKEAKSKSPKFSIVWLVEWSKKIIKKFLGKVIYRD